jgi:hypothetical protein
LEKAWAKAGTAADLLADRRTVAEGAYTAPVLKRAADEAGVDMPIVEAVCALLSGKTSVNQIWSGSSPVRYGPRALRSPSRSLIFPVAVAGRLLPFRAAMLLAFHQRPGSGIGGLLDR